MMINKTSTEELNIEFITLILKSNIDNLIKEKLIKRYLREQEPIIMPMNTNVPTILTEAFTKLYPII